MMIEMNAPTCSASVEQAKGLLMELFGVSGEQADELLDAWARRCKRSPELVAEVFVCQVWQGDDSRTDRNVARALEHALRNLPHAVASSME
ncbi:hypothetical protein GCM10009789_07210 [Kribbella sancticallisti]|uniref:ANTAR domain-containing protein n=1 Tax=Kribbella sancticallisti TaxID=460087 RepID=A0ABP4N930_9ACTN